jgi:hypothetical protein
VPEIRDRLLDQGLDVPLVGDFHFNGHQLLREFPATAVALAKYRINPGNVGVGERHDANFVTMIEVAKDHDRPVRIGVNWGSLDQALLTELMDENARLAAPRSAHDVMIEAMLQSALRSAELAEATGLGSDRIVLSAKVSQVPDLWNVYRQLAARCDLPAAPRPHRGGHGPEGRGRLGCRPGPAARRGHRRHDPGVVDARAGRAARARGRDRPGGPAGRGPSSLRAQRHRLPGVRAHHQHALPGDGARHPGLPQGEHAGVARDVPRGRGPAASR